MRFRAGFSLLEAVVAMALLALGILFVLGIVPTGLVSCKRSEDIEAATAYATELIEDSRRTLPPAGMKEFDVAFNQTAFKIQREIAPVDATLTDVMVTVHWSDTLPDLRPVTRVNGQPPASSP